MWGYILLFVTAKRQLSSLGLSIISFFQISLFIVRIFFSFLDFISPGLHARFSHACWSNIEWLAVLPLSIRSRFIFHSGRLAFHPFGSRHIKWQLDIGVVQIVCPTNYPNILYRRFWLCCTRQFFISISACIQNRECISSFGELVSPHSEASFMFWQIIENVKAFDTHDFQYLVLNLDGVVMHFVLYKIVCFEKSRTIDAEIKLNFPKFSYEHWWNTVISGIL